MFSTDEISPLPLSFPLPHTTHTTHKKKKKGIIDTLYGIQNILYRIQVWTYLYKSESVSWVYVFQSNDLRRRTELSYISGVVFGAFRVLPSHRHTLPYIVHLLSHEFITKMLNFALEDIFRPLHLDKWYLALGDVSAAWFEDMKILYWVSLLRTYYALLPKLSPWIIL